VSPLNPTNVQTTTPAPVTVQTLNSVLNSQTTTDGSSAPTQESSAQSSTAQTGAKGTASPPPKGKTQSVVGLVLSLELFVKPGLQQANVFPDVTIVQGISNNTLMQDSIMMGLLQQPGFNQPEYNQDLGFEQ
jgi:hypothetical protein